MTAVDRLREANRYEMKLANGIPIRFRLPSLEEMIVARLVPLSILDEVRQRLIDASRREAEGATEAEIRASVEEAEASVLKSMDERLTEYETDYEAKQRVVARMIVEVDGEPAELTPADTLELPPQNFRELVAIAVRGEPPRAEGEV